MGSFDLRAELQWRQCRCLAGRHLGVVLLGRPGLEAEGVDVGHDCVQRLIDGSVAVDQWHALEAIGHDERQELGTTAA